jgi:DNA invertase Pin-like site-specific DNA recombinase
MSGALAPVCSRRRAAQYLRMSTEHQRYSPKLQAAAISAFAKARGYEVVRTYADEGISGVGIKNRRGLRMLLTDVLRGDCGFDTILVYDVSRWGRFQNPDQSAHYEFLCAQAGVHVEYCAELFDNDGSLPSTLLKSLKRVMAAEYSRELSVKTSATKTAMFRSGYWQGGSPGLGLRRQVISPDGVLGVILNTGEFKAIQKHRCILVPGPLHEIALVKRIYRMFTAQRLNRGKIVRILNAEGLLGEGGKPWSRRMVHGVLSNPKYVGDLVGDRTSCILQTRRIRRPPAEWARKSKAFEPIISRKLFARAQVRLAEDSPVYMSRAEMVAALRRIYDQHGKITFTLINETPGLPWTGAFRREFSAPAGLYAAIGETMKHRPRKPRLVLSDEEILERLSALLARTGLLNKTLIDADPTLPAVTTVTDHFGSLTNAYRRIGFVQIPHRERRTAASRARGAAARSAQRPGDPI